jgi:hypothetical protein
VVIEGLGGDRHGLLLLAEHHLPVVAPLLGGVELGLVRLPPGLRPVKLTLAPFALDAVGEGSDARRQLLAIRVVLRVIQDALLLGISAISGADQLVNSLLFANLEAWGWVFVLWGAVEILAGLAIMRGATWGILVGILFAFVGCVMHLTFASADPVFSLTIVAVDVLVIYGLTVYGFEHRNPLR